MLAAKMVTKDRRLVDRFPQYLGIRKAIKVLQEGLELVPQKAAIIDRRLANWKG